MNRAGIRIIVEEKDGLFQGQKYVKVIVSAGGSIRSLHQVKQLPRAGGIVDVGTP